ncbi:hypothetical protein SAMN05216326_12564 [Nitrosomonas marina]|uniref:Uncharacterized protein n=1 Tax=Nitrosomonas marina TaxID=917 RepID=A0A1I0E947_9PROT|nr:hypothetical protein [Nitrosomonas marina]SET41379.1 hypothetical protein SAMN05216326_12564 [Nitrosomonas marina]
MPNIKQSSFLAKLGMPAKRWSAEHITPANEIKPEDAYLYGGGSTTIASLLGTGRRGARARQVIYNKWDDMESDAIVSSSLKLLVTSALGGHETTGDVVFIEQKPDTESNKKLKSMTEEIKDTLGPILNKKAYQCAYTGAAFGDAYARIYSKDNVGVVDLYTDELVRPQLIQPFERGNRTIGFQSFINERNPERLTVAQMARLKMPRTQWVPQHGVVEKAIRMMITEDDLDSVPVMPSMAGGSLLYNVEQAYDNLYASLIGLVGQRWIDSIDEKMLQLNMESMTLEQQKSFLASVKTMFESSKKRAETAVQEGKPLLERIWHMIPVWGEKQLTTISNADGGQTERTGTITVEDVIFHARLLSGGIGVDMSMIGFADQMAGGLGEGGFFRTSAQAAENARHIRTSLADFIYHIIDIHTLKKYGVVFSASERPWTVNFYGSISALEAEKQRTRQDSMNAGMILVQAMQQMKDIGATEEIMEDFLTKEMLLDEDQAKTYAAIVKAKDEDETNDDGFGNRSGGGFGNRSGEDPKMDSATQGDVDLREIREVLMSVAKSKRSSKRLSEISSKGLKYIDSIMGD